MTSRTAHGYGLLTLHGDIRPRRLVPGTCAGRSRRTSTEPAGLSALAVPDEARGVTREVRLVRGRPRRGPRRRARTRGCGCTCCRTGSSQPNSISLDGLFGALTNVVWTNHGPCAVDGFETTRLALLARGPVQVFGVDKFPRMTDYVVPSGVRIADADRVRLGAHLASGTTVMHEGFVNFNAGTLGSSMVEGRISQGVVVGDGSDIGGGASTMGTLSGGGTERVSIGQRCLLGAESGLGIALGDDCVIEAGLYVTAGTKVTLPDGTVTKASELSGQSNLLFLRNSVTGTVEARPRDGHGIVLNSALHAND